MKKAMDKLREVESAKLLMNEAVNWSVMTWMREKKRVRAAADQANAALDQARASIGEQWKDDVRVAYTVLSKANGNGQKASPDGEASRIAMQIKQADKEARQARMDAEDTFNKAEKQLSTSLAREGCRKAIRSWELHEQAIHLAQTVGAKKI